MSIRWEMVIFWSLFIILYMALINSAHFLDGLTQLNLMVVGLALISMGIIRTSVS